MWKAQYDKPKKKTPGWPPSPLTKDEPKPEETPVETPVSRIVPIRELRERKRELIRKAQEDVEED